jgi:2-keto-4-pentenoate hydratase/2-oxohepta-3-ene-1,7-dioic acid hydratase in catechol pathway
MRLISFRDTANAKIGVLADDETVVDLSVAVPRLAREMTKFVAAGREGLELARNALRATGGARLQRSAVKLLAPFPRPAKNIFCVGKNYRAHAQEFEASGFDASSGNSVIPDVPIVFTKPATSVIGPGEPIPSGLDPTQSVDYEGELAVVIGPGGRGIKKEDAFRHVYGYTILNDVTARTLQHRHKQWFLGKSLDGFCPMGPWLVTADAVPDVTKLRLVTRVNGEGRQDAMLSDLIFDVPSLIETISEGITLEPGDVIATGTPSGVGIGFDPPKYLKPGDRVAVTIEPLGTLENPVA